MKTYPMPQVFDGAKFALRYGLHDGPGSTDFWSDGALIHVPDNLPDDPPIFEGPNLITLIPSTEWSASGTSFASKPPAGYAPIRVGSTTRYIPFFA